MKLIHHHFETLPSTNDWAKAHLMTFDRSSLTLVTADGQTAARGQYGRRWFAPPHVNLYATFCFFLNIDIEIFTLTHLLAQSTIAIAPPLPYKIKWPNDIMVKGKKLAGILCEVIDQRSIVLGLGLNINMESEAISKIDQPATSLLIETGTPHDKAILLTRLTTQFSTDLAHFLNASERDVFYSFY